MNAALSLKLIKKLSVLFTITLLSCISACKKDVKEEPEKTNPKFRLTKWEHIVYDDTTTHLFEYNNEGKVSKYTYVLPYDEIQGPRNVISTYHYGINGKIATEDRIPSSNTGGKPIKGTYTYTTDGKLESLEYKDFSGKVTLRLDYQYSDKTVVLNITTENDPELKTCRINFGEDGNITRMEQQIAPTQYAVSVEALKYDINPNAFSTITGMESLYLAKGDIFNGILTKNNIVSYSFPAIGKTISVLCKYNEYGYITEYGDLISDRDGYVFTYENY